MKSFKQFLSELTVNSEIATKAQADGVLSRTSRAGLQAHGTIDGYELLVSDKALALFDGSTCVLKLDLMPKSLKLPGGTVAGFVTSGLWAAEAARGKGLALKLYEQALELHGALFSDRLQTPGSAKLWKALAVAGAFVVVEEDKDFYLHKHEHDEEHDYEADLRVLLAGSPSKLADEVAANHSNIWLALKPGAFDKVSRLAINI